MYENIQEGQYLIKVLSASINNTTLNPPADDLDWEQLYRLAAFHNVSNATYYGLLKLSDTSIIPKEILSRFTADKKKYSSLEALQHFEVRQILLRFERNQVFCLPLSGYVMKNLYPRPDMRFLATISLLIKPQDKELARVLLENLGYNQVNSSDTSVSLFKAPNLTIELHTALLPQTNDYYEYFTKMTDERLLKENGVRYIHSFSKEDFYIYLITLSAHKYASGCASICSILDIWIYLKRYNALLDRDLISMELERLNLGLFSYYIEELSWIWFGDGVSSFINQPLYTEMEQHIFSCGVGEHFDIKTPTSDVPSAAKTKPLSTKERIKLFPPLDILSENYPILKKMPFLLPVCWLVRLSGVLLSRIMPSKSKKDS